MAMAHGYFLRFMNYEVYLALVQKKTTHVYVCWIRIRTWLYHHPPKNHPVIFFTSFCWILKSDRILFGQKVHQRHGKMPQMYGVLGLETNHVWICRLYLKCFFDRWPLHLFLMTRVHQAVLVVGQGKHTMVKKHKHRISWHEKTQTQCKKNDRFFDIIPGKKRTTPFR